MTLATLTLALLLTDRRGPCVPSANHSVQIHWSQGQTVFSPSCKWVIEVRSGGEGAPAKVFIRKVDGGSSHFLFAESRDAEVRWDETDSALIVRDMQFSDRYNLLLFDPLDADQGRKRASLINSQILAAVKGKLGHGENIVYFLPDLVRWSEEKVIVSVGVVTVRGESGPFTRHCFGYVIGRKSVKIEDQLDEAGLKVRFGGVCQIWP